MKNINLIIVTGLSGAGKTQAIWSLEDLGYFCVDNLPPTLIPKFAELCTQSGGKVNKVALVIDIRGGEFFEGVFETLATLRESGIRYEILFLEASNETLVRRFKETRRRHPLSPQGQVLDGILEERQRLEDLRGRANKIIDTTEMSNQQLKQEITAMFGDCKDVLKLRVTIMSFGFKYGIPLDSDLVIDVRFLPNPYYIEELRPFTGNDQKIQEYVFGSPVTKTFMRKFYSLVKFLIPHYIKEGKTNLVIAIGCTGGQHRSVTLANRMGIMLEKHDHDGYTLQVKHRDMPRHTGGEKKE
ncbi:MAG: RNase adapter RapZ [Desulfitobacterium hafniense]|nr:RNase adapter RapZ [Desulfitobacterium hafniense]